MKLFRRTDPLDRVHPFILLHGKPATYRQIDKHLSELGEIERRWMDAEKELAESLRELYFSATGKRISTL